MEDICQICSNINGNRRHKVREMMFGTRDEFDYIECGRCGTLQIAAIPDLSKYYPTDYFSFEAKEPEIGETFLRRLASKLSGNFLLTGNGFIGQAILNKKPWLRDHFPASLTEPILGINKNSRILDLGCGNGKLLQAMHYFGFSDLTGADALIENDINYKTGVKVLRKPIKEIDGIFDLIMLHHSFEHFADPKESLLQIHRLLDGDKFALIRIPVLNFAWEKYGVNWVQLDPPRHLFLYTERSFRELAASCGFKTEKVIYDSSSFQFWGSEQYRLDVPLNDPRSHNGQNGKIFSDREIYEWQKKAEKLNANDLGDQAAFYLQRI
jgi:SAM-dependent methyltransferase